MVKNASLLCMYLFTRVTTCILHASVHHGFACMAACCIVYGMHIMLCVCCVCMCLAVYLYYTVNSVCFIGIPTAEPTPISLTTSPPSTGPMHHHPNRPYTCHHTHYSRTSSFISIGCCSGSSNCHLATAASNSCVCDSVSGAVLQTQKR